MVVTNVKGIEIRNGDWMRFLAAVGLVLASVAVMAQRSQWPVMPSLLVCLILSGICSLLCFVSIPEVGNLLLKAGLGGKDCHRKEPAPIIPEGTGVAVGFTYVIALTAFLPMVLEELPMYLAAILSINSMCFLGFADNVLNLRWRHKLSLPSIACLPVLLVYYMQGGSTYVLVPDVVRKYFFHQESLGAVDFGIFYYVFLAMLSVFGTNAINILAGLNGLEVGQSIVITGASITNVLIQMNRHSWDQWQFNTETVFALFLLVPFLCCSIALWIFNKYPARVFVGDTYCYLAGTVLAVSGILGHFSKTLLLFMFPQVLNFLYSIPQLFRLIPCPRHRMPVYVPGRDCVNVSYSDWVVCDSVCRPVIWFLTSFKLANVERKGDMIRFSNLTLLNFVLWKTGRPMKEARIVSMILLIQLFWTIIAFFLRYKAAAFFYSLVD
jgi:UDP-N-acetylglucosamine--dolichyl-phosphate N-acetylglucosaminephosphotransferase